MSDSDTSSPSALSGARLGSFFRLANHGWRERRFLVMLLLFLGSAWIFAELAEEVMEGETHTLDILLLTTMRDYADSYAPPWLEEVGRDITALGGVVVLLLMVCATIGLLLLQGKTHAALAVLIAAGGGMLLSSLLKIGFDRPRPDLVPHGATVYTASFPSGHSMMSAVVYLTLGALLARTEPEIRMKIYYLALALLLTILVGVSRVYLGVHWPSDVLAGWTAGAAWALLCWLVTYYLQRFGRVERD